MFSLLFYRLFLLLLLPLFLAAIILRSQKSKAYRQRLPERLGLCQQPYQSGGIIVHAASVGEVIALKSFIEQLTQRYSNLPITVTTFTPTGSDQVKKLFGTRVQHSYLPLDIYPCTSIFLTRLKPKLMIFMETELWPNLIAQCKNKKIKLLLINARLSKSSLKNYQKITPLIRPCLNHFDKILCQSQENLHHFLALGADIPRCINTGNLKFDINLTTQIVTKQAELSQYMTQNRTIWLVASTHQGDEEIALNAFKKLQAHSPELLLLLVPRHPERFNNVAQLCQKTGFTIARRSKNEEVEHQDIWLLDTLGELMAAFSLADIVTMGGSFSHIGGHNPLEPALFKKPIIVGSNMSNFNEVTQQLLQQQGIIQLEAKATHDNNLEQSQQLCNKVIELIETPRLQRLIGEHAYQVVLANQGASKTTLHCVQTLI